MSRTWRYNFDYTHILTTLKSLIPDTRCVTDYNGQFPLNIVNEVKGTETE
jgi:hypothetical protein